MGTRSWVGEYVSDGGYRGRQVSQYNGHPHAFGNTLLDRTRRYRGDLRAFLDDLYNKRGPAVYKLTESPTRHDQVTDHGEMVNWDMHYSYVFHVEQKRLDVLGPSLEVQHVVDFTSGRAEPTSFPLEREPTAVVPATLELKGILSYWAGRQHDLEVAMSTLRKGLELQLGEGGWQTLAGRSAYHLVRLGSAQLQFPAASTRPPGPEKALDTVWNFSAYPEGAGEGKQVSVRLKRSLPLGTTERDLVNELSYSIVRGLWMEAGGKEPIPYRSYATRLPEVAVRRIELEEPGSYRNEVDYAVPPDQPCWLVLDFLGVMDQRG